MDTVNDDSEKVESRDWIQIVQLVSNGFNGTKHPVYKEDVGSIPTCYNI